MQLNGIRRSSTNLSTNVDETNRPGGGRSLPPIAEELHSRRLDENYGEQLVKDPNLSRIITLLPTCNYDAQSI